MPVDQECLVTADVSKAGSATMTGVIQSQTVHQVHVDVNDSSDGTISLRYKFPAPGTYTLSVLFAGKLIPDGCFQQTVS